MTAIGPSSRIGFVGLGRMGLPMAANLRAAGYPVVVYDRSPAAMELAVEHHSMTPAGSPSTMAKTVDIVITMLPTDEAVATTVEVEGGLLSGRPEGLFVLDMGSSSAGSTRRLGALLRRHRGHLVDAPVSGGVERARDGSLSVMVGGDPADIDRCEPILTVLGSRVHRTGQLGTGHAMKALNNLLSALGLLGAIEVLLIGERAGLDPGVMLEVLNTSSGRNHATEHQAARFVLSHEYDSGFSLDLMVKDLHHAAELVTDITTDLPLTSAGIAAWERALTALGPGHDHIEVARWLGSLTGGSHVGA